MVGKFSGHNWQPLIAIFCPAEFDCNVAAFDKSGFAQALPERSDKATPWTGRLGVEKPDHRHRRLLSPRRKRPRRRGAEQRDDFAPTDHSITSSARASSMGGTSRPSALAV